MDLSARPRASSAQNKPEKEFPNAAKEALRPRLSAVATQEAVVERRSSARIRRDSVVSLVLGTAGLVLWLVPWAGFPVGFYGLVQGVRARYRAPKTSRAALAGILLCALSMSLAVANLVVGAYLGNSGKNMFSGILFR